MLRWICEETHVTWSSYIQHLLQKRIIPELDPQEQLATLVLLGKLCPGWKIQTAESHGTLSRTALYPPSSILHDKVSLLLRTSYKICTVQCKVLGSLFKMTENFKRVTVEHEVGSFLNTGPWVTAQVACPWSQLCFFLTHTPTNTHDVCWVWETFIPFYYCFWCFFGVF